jgi:PAS domain S-box-containing protein
LVDKKGPNHLVLPEDWPTVEENLRKRISGEIESIRYEFRGLTKSKKSIYVEVYGTRTVYHGRPAVIGTLLDITERKRAEEALSESEENYRSIFESANDAIFVHDMETGAILDVNEKMLQMYGYKTKKEILGGFVTDLSSGDEPYSEKEAIEWVKKGEKGKPQLFEWHAKDRKGNLFWVEVNLKKVKLRKKDRLLALVRDITERKRAEEALKESEEKFKGIFDKALDGILLADVEDRRFLTGNKAVCEMLGYSAGEIKNLGVMDIHPEEDLPYVIDKFERQTSGEIELAGDIPIKRKDGRVFYADIKSSPITLAGKTYLVGIFRDITERKRVEGALRESEEKFRTMTESSLDGIVVMDGEGVITYFNKAAEDVLGYKGKEIIGKKVHDILVSKESKKEYYGRLPRFKKTGKCKVTGKTCEMFAAAKDGRRIPLEISISSMKVSGDWYSVASFRDVTERKRAEEALWESEKKYRDLVDNALVGIYNTNLKGDILFANDALLGMFGYRSEKELMKENVRARYRKPEERTAFLKELRKNGRVTNYEIQYVAKGGKVLDVLESATLVGGVISGMLMDITERKRAEEELKRSAIYLDAMPDVLCVASPEGKIIKVNQTFYNLWDYSPEEVIGRPALLMFSEGERSKLKKEAKTAIKTGKPGHFETSILTKHGEEIPVSVSEMALKDEKGKVTAIVTVLKDITIPKKAESALRQAYDEVKSIGELKSDIIANVTHELRTPITIARGAMEMAMHEEKPDDRVALLKMAMDALSRQNVIIGDLITATKIRREKKPELVHTDLNAVIPLVSNEFKPLLIKNKITLEIDLDKNLPSVMVDLDGLSHILRNLISNAIKFNKVGGGVRVTAVEKGSFVEVCVSDTGVGMSNEVRERVFERFYQADSSTGRQYSGIGLGLTIVKEMVKINGGEIRVKSQVGKGSTFCFTLLAALS